MMAWHLSISGVYLFSCEANASGYITHYGIFMCLLAFYITQSGRDLSAADAPLRKIQAQTLAKQ